MAFQLRTLYTFQQDPISCPMVTIKKNWNGKAVSLSVLPVPAPVCGEEHAFQHLGWLVSATERPHSGMRLKACVSHPKSWQPYYKISILSQWRTQNELKIVLVLLIWLDGSEILNKWNTSENHLIYTIVFTSSARKKHIYIWENCSQKMIV